MLHTIHVPTDLVKMSADAASHHKKVDESEPYHHHVPRVSLLTPFYSGIYMESEENAVVIPVVAAPAPAKEVNSLNVNYRGLLNLWYVSPAARIALFLTIIFSLIVLTLSNVRLMVENIRKYGILLDFSVSTEGFDLQSWPSVSTVASFSLYILAFWLMELRANAEARALIANRKASTPLLRVIVPLHVILLIAVVLQPPVVIWFMQPPPLANLLVMMISTVLFTKLWSYAAVNRKLRRTWMTAATAKKTDDGDTTAPKASEPVITLGGLAYFMALPTLCYQPVFPRTPAIRWAFVLRLVVELSFICFVEYFIAMQYMLPLLNNTLGPVARLDVVQIVERVLKIAVPNLIIWLLGFYAFFHLYLNLIAELLRFADREFYRDWWNCTTVVRIIFFWYVRQANPRARATFGARGTCRCTTFSCSTCSSRSSLSATGAPSGRASLSFSSLPCSTSSSSLRPFRRSASPRSAA